MVSLRFKLHVKHDSLQQAHFYEAERDQSPQWARTNRRQSTARPPGGGRRGQLGEAGEGAGVRGHKGEEQGGQEGQGGRQHLQRHHGLLNTSVSNNPSGIRMQCME